MSLMVRNIRRWLQNDKINIPTTKTKPVKPINNNSIFYLSIYIIYNFDSGISIMIF